MRLGLTWVWLGLEGEDSRYAKLHGADTRALVRRLQAHGTRVLGSTIIGLEDHTPENIDAAIEHAVSHDTVFHQFMLYTPLPGTPLYADLSAQGRMKDESECNLADIHGQSLFNYRHPHIRGSLETELIVRAFQRDFEVNGPSMVRMARTMLAGWKRHKNHPDPRVRRRFAWEARDLSTRLPGRGRRGAALLPRQSRAAGEDGRAAQGLARRVRPEVAVLRRRGRAVRATGRCAARRSGLRGGWTYEPPTFYERNEAAQRLASGNGPQATLCQPLTCRSAAMPIVERDSFRCLAHADVAE